MNLKSRRLSALATIAAALFLSTFSVTARASALETIQERIAQYLKRPGIRSTDWGIEILDPTNHTVLVSVNPDKTFKPASVLKVVTTAAALEKLGPDFRYRTGVYSNGSVGADGTLVGDVILVGRGDPNLVDLEGDLLSKPALTELAEKMKALGIRRIRGEIVGDDGYYEPGNRSKGWTSQDLKSVYGAPSSALSINNNVFWVHARPTKLNSRVTVGVEPRTSYFRVRNLGITGGTRSKRTLYARLIPGTRNLVISGVLPARSGFSQHLILENPTEVTAGMFKEQLEAQGIAVEGAVRTLHHGDVAPDVRRRWSLMAEHLSPPLIRSVEIINKRSQNLHAEMLLRTLGAETSGVGSDEAGLKAVRDFLVEAGIESKDVRLNDGCGLSRDNLVTPRFQTSLLLFLSTRPHFELFLNTLAVSGTDGTLRNRLGSQPLKGVIHAKTGTLNGVATLSGYMTTKSGRNLIFSIFANNASASMGRIRRTIDEICALFVNLY